MTPQETHPIYLDNAATTPVREEVIDAMAPFMNDIFGNPSSQHAWGRAASARLENARAEAAEALNVKASEVFFVRGGTEADNIAILGSARALSASEVRPTILVSAIEHPAVLNAAEAAASLDLADVVTLGVRPDGSIDMPSVEAALQSGPALISCMWVNNETGLRLPVPELAEVAEAHGALLHTDAVQAVGKIPVDLGAAPLHTLTVSGHKIQGPKGTGLLFVRAGTPIRPLLHGGGQERALRPGTEDVAGAVGVACALRLAVQEQEAEAARLGALRDELESRLVAELQDVKVNANEGPRAPHVSNVGFPGVEGSMLLISLDLEGLAVSGTSACSSGSTGGSHVLRALYGDAAQPAQVRFSLGHITTATDIARAATLTVSVVRRLRGAQ